MPGVDDRVEIGRIDLVDRIACGSKLTAGLAHRLGLGRVGVAAGVVRH